MGFNAINLPRVEVGTTPTPLHRLSKLSAQLGGPELWIKRDDLIGVADGGNKIRKLRFLIGRAIADGCDCVLTGGAAQSNHCRQTAAVASMHGLEAHLAIGGDEPKEFVGNVLISKILGAQFHWCGANRKGEQLDNLFAELQSQGRRPFLVPYGGSSALGATGFLEAALELQTQCRTQDIRFDRIVLPASSGGSIAGLLAGYANQSHSPLITGNRIDEEDGDATLRSSIVRFANGCLSLAKLPGSVEESSVHLDSISLNASYGVVTDADRNALQSLARTEGILTDPVYSARALSGLFARIADGTISPEERVLFWHTGGTTALHAFGRDFTQEFTPSQH